MPSCHSLFVVVFVICLFVVVIFCLCLLCSFFVCLFVCLFFTEIDVIIPKRTEQRRNAIGRLHEEANRGDVSQHGGLQSFGCVTTTQESA